MPGTPIGAFAWITPSLQPDWNLEDTPYQLQVLVQAFAYDETGHQGNVPGEGFETWEGNRIENYLICAGDETAESLRGKAITWIRACYGLPTLPVTFILDSPGAGTGS
jgi:hypothetical protein